MGDAHVQEHSRFLGLRVAFLARRLAKEISFVLGRLVRSLLLLFRGLARDWRNVLCFVLLAYGLGHFLLLVLWTCLVCLLIRRLW